MKSNFPMKQLLLLAAVCLSSIPVWAQNSDTSKICTGQGVVLEAPAPPSTITYKYYWFDESNASAGTTSTLTIAANSLENNSPSPRQHIYKLVVEQDGGASCPSDTFYKSIIVYPNLSNEVTAEFPFYCSSSPMDINLEAAAKAGAPASTPATLTLGSGTYGVLTYSWTGTGVSPSTTSTTKILASEIQNLLVGANEVKCTVSYVDVLSAGTTITTCLSSEAAVNVNITNAPSVNGTAVSTTYN